MKKLRNGVSVLMLGFALATSAEPARAVHDCIGAVIDECSAAMDGESMVTRWLFALVCTGLIIGCG